MVQGAGTPPPRRCMMLQASPAGGRGRTGGGGLVVARGKMGQGRRRQARDATRFVPPLQGVLRRPNKRNRLVRDATQEVVPPFKACGEGRSSLLDGSSRTEKGRGQAGKGKEVPPGRRRPVHERPGSVAEERDHVGMTRASPVVARAARSPLSSTCSHASWRIPAGVDTAWTCACRARGFLEPLYECR